MTSETSINGYYAVMPDRGFIRVGGDEAAPFLQSILTTNIDHLHPNTAMAGALLTPQGRILVDMMLYRQDAAIIIECRADAVQDLYTRLRRFRLRRPVSLDIIDWHCWLFWGGAAPDDSVADPRGTAIGDAALGHRWIGPIDATPTHQAALAPIDAWHSIRIAAGIPEGPIDLVPERALMLEAAFDKLGAVDFGKGCYVGQEVTARTHYRGLVKRRLVPLKMAGTAPAPDTEIILDGRTIGATKSSAAFGAVAVALAALKLSDIHNILAVDAGLTIDGTSATLAIPDWMLPLPSPAKTDSPSP